MTKPTVDEFVQARVAPEMQPIVARLRELMRTLAPTAREMISYDMPVWVEHHIIAYLTAAPQHVTFSFTLGVNFEDKYGLLKGKAKHARYLRLKKVEEINQAALRY
jgi:hypothetical protein